VGGRPHHKQRHSYNVCTDHKNRYPCIPGCSGGRKNRKWLPCPGQARVVWYYMTRFSPVQCQDINKEKLKNTGNDWWDLPDVWTT
jgi:hypothetical protein